MTSVLDKLLAVCLIVICMPVSHARASDWAGIVAQPCGDLIRAYGTEKLSILMEPVEDYLDTEGPKVDSPFATSSSKAAYMASVCRSSPRQSIGQAARQLLDRAKLGNLPKIPPQGATNDPAVKKQRDQFDKWIKMRGPKPR